MLLRDLFSAHCSSRCTLHHIHFYCLWETLCVTNSTSQHHGVCLFFILHVFLYCSILVLVSVLSMICYLVVFTCIRSFVYIHHGASLEGIIFISLFEPWFLVLIFVSFYFMYLLYVLLSSVLTLHYLATTLLD